MLIYRTRRGVIAATENGYVLISQSWDSLLATTGLPKRIDRIVSEGVAGVRFDLADTLVPLVSQEVWGAGVTYYRSRDARMAESEEAGGGSFYDRVYTAQRPELFFKGNSRTTVGHGDCIGIRTDARWSVPEPELVLLSNANGELIGCTIGNDVTARDIEGENPLYLPQAKIYNASCAIGPGLLVSSDPLPRKTIISLEIKRHHDVVYAGKTTLAELKRDTQELLEYLHFDNNFSHGCYLMTGTGIVPPDGFALVQGDTVTITIPPIGTLSNIVG